MPPALCSERAPQPIVRPVDCRAGFRRSIGELDLDRRSPSGRRSDLQASSGALDPLALGLQADVSLGNALREQARVEAAAVVAHGQLDRAVALPELDRDVRRRRVQCGVREQLARGAEEQDLLSMPLRMGEVEVDAEAAAAGRPLPRGAQRGLESGLLENVGVQLEYGLAELGDRRLDRGVRTAERLGRVASVRGLLEIVPRREQVLDRMVVEPLGQDAEALPLAGARASAISPRRRSASSASAGFRSSTAERSTAARPIQSM